MMGRRSTLLVAAAGLLLVGLAEAFVPPPHSRGGTLVQQRRASTVVKTWVDTKVGIEVPADPTVCYELYSQLEEHPRWSPWLRSVVFLDHAERVSEWTLESRGVRVAWKARNTIEEHGKCIQWESITGLPNKGLVTFEEKAPGLTAMELTISYSVPKPIAKVAGNVRFVQKYIESTLLEDLTRYKKELLKEVREGGSA